MAVHFAYRCDETGEPTALYRRRFEDATLIGWLRRVWRPIADLEEAHQYANEILGVSVPYVGFVFVTIAESSLEPPASLKEVRQVFHQTGYFTVSPDAGEEHAFQALADDGDGDSVVYLFDDDFAGRYLEQTAFLLADWPLPDASGGSKAKWKSSHPAVEKLDPAFRRKGEGRVYSFANVRLEKLQYTDTSAEDVDLLVGLRLPELCRCLMSEAASEIDASAYLLQDLRKVLLTEDLTGDEQEMAFIRSLREEPQDEATWHAYSDWLLERDEPAPGVRLLRLILMRYRRDALADPSRNVVHVGEHVVQCRLHEGGDYYLEWFVFDDLWGAAHPVLADSLLRYCTRWDILTTGSKKVEPP